VRRDILVLFKFVIPAILTAKLATDLIKKIVYLAKNDKVLHQSQVNNFLIIRIEFFLVLYTIFKLNYIFFHAVLIRVS
jgi:hypothetical protein